MNHYQRPHYHVTPWKNWANDPNGLIFDGKHYHVFYQHNPDAQAWGPMHWGHATSKDLYRWRHRPIALYPDKDGTCFSGSAILDQSNASGLRTEEGNPILLFYTSHPEAAEDGKHYQAQSLAISYDGKAFAKYEHNPVLPNQGSADFRDPKVFYYEPLKHWVMLLTSGDRLSFYTSQDLLTWGHASDFTPQNNTISGIWECPDLFPLDYKGEEYWVLLASMSTSEAEGKAVTQYVIGDFDGYAFTEQEQGSESRLIDEGPDNYAAVSFHGTRDRIIMGWALNWGYAAQTPTEGFTGQMTSPREVTLYRSTDGLISLASQPVPIPKRIVSEVQTFASSRVQHSFGGLPLIVEFTPEEQDPSFELTFRNDHGEHLHVWQDADRYLTVDRSHSGDLSFHPLLEQELYRKRTVAPRTKRPGTYYIMLDGPLLEVYADDGSRVITMTAYPKEPYTKLEIRSGETLYGRLGVLEEFEPAFPKNPYKHRV